MAAVLRAGSLADRGRARAVCDEDAGQIGREEEALPRSQAPHFTVFCRGIRACVGWSPGYQDVDALFDLLEEAGCALDHLYILLEA